MRSTECPKCGGPLVPLRSLLLKLCTDCQHEVPWPLAPGQPPLITTNRDKRKDKSHEL